MEIEVRTLPHLNLPPSKLFCPSSRLIAQIKQQLADDHVASGWCADGMNLMFQGRVLSDDRTLEACSVTTGSFLVLTGMVPIQTNNEQAVTMPGSMPPVPEALERL